MGWRRSLFSLTLLASMPWLAGGCDRDAVRTYQAPKAPPPAAQTPSAPSALVDPGGQAAPPAHAPEATWTLPAGWRELPPTSSMRVATLAAGEGAEAVEVVVTQFPGDVGGVLANVNRWRGQIGLPPVAEAELEQHVQRLEGKHVPNLLAVDMVGPAAEGRPPVRMVAVLLPDPAANATWFVKAVAEPPRLEPHAQAILDFARSFRFAPAAGHPSATTPVPMLPADMAARAAEDHPAAPGEIHWQVPAGWRADPAPAPGGMIHSAFQASSPAGDAAIAVSVFPGDVGGLLANINRWRGQVGLAPVSDLSEQPPTPLPMTGGVVAGLLTFTAQGDDPARPAMQVAVVAREQPPGSTWFFKLSGPKAAVDAQAQSFRQFVQSVHFH